MPSKEVGRFRPTRPERAARKSTAHSICRYHPENAAPLLQAPPQAPRPAQPIFLRNPQGILSDHPSHSGSVAVLLHLNLWDLPKRSRPWKNPPGDLVYDANFFRGLAG